MELWTFLAESHLLESELHHEQPKARPSGSHWVATVMELVSVQVLGDRCSHHKRHKLTPLSFSLEDNEPSLWWWWGRIIHNVAILRWKSGNSVPWAGTNLAPFMCGTYLSWIPLASGKKNRNPISKDFQWLRLANDAFLGLHKHQVLRLLSWFCGVVIRCTVWKLYGRKKKQNWILGLYDSIELGYLLLILYFFLCLFWGWLPGHLFRVWMIPSDGRFNKAFNVLVKRRPMWKSNVETLLLTQRSKSGIQGASFQLYSFLSFWDRQSRVSCHLFTLTWGCDLGHGLTSRRLLVVLVLGVFWPLKFPRFI